MKTKYLIAGALATLSVNAFASDEGTELKPYAFGTMGAVYDELELKPIGFKDNQTKFGAQVGVGVNFNDNLGVELAYQHSSRHFYEGELADGSSYSTQGISNRTLAARATVGGSVTPEMRLFAKVGVAGVKHSNSSFYRKNQARVTAGVGMTYAVDDNWSVRADYDHYFKRSADSTGATWKGANYAGAGFQYNF